MSVRASPSPSSFCALQGVLQMGVAAVWMIMNAWGRILKSRIFRKCRDPGSNRGSSDLQSDALPTELSRLWLYFECAFPRWLSGLGGAIARQFAMNTQFCLLGLGRLGFFTGWMCHLHGSRFHNGSSTTKKTTKKSASPPPLTLIGKCQVLGIYISTDPACEHKWN